ncbi:hypothetical protein A2U01_0072286, partial [Trifolium medium]|nr:hypothetical protein [Trifolium medium]
FLELVVSKESFQEFVLQLLPHMDGSTGQALSRRIEKDGPMDLYWFVHQTDFHVDLQERSP